MTGQSINTARFAGWDPEAVGFRVRLCRLYVILET